MNFNKHIPETELVDFLMGNVEEKVKRQMTLHIQNCHQCWMKCKQWESLLTQDEVQTNPLHSTLQERIWYALDSKKERQKWWNRPKSIFAFGTGITVFALIYLLITNPLYPYKNDQLSIDQHIPNTDVLIQPTTKQYSIKPLSTHDSMDGKLWINYETEEILLEVDGLRDYANQDYQVWIVYRNDYIVGEVLQIINGSARLFISGSDVNQFKLIKASIEPKGGSLIQTGPDTFIVDFHK